ncbi:MAG: LysM peptidoglycan-binding domain-containing protein [Cyanobium sp. CZS 25K]|nr:LysM peptidoglycan-binding domain-containing protein [Cyanobium sp. CZS25K]
MAFGQGAPPARSVRVVQGDTLEAIAARNGVSLQELIRLNKITKPEELQIGQQLKLPPAKGLVQVRAGDTMAALAARHGTTTAELQKANPGVKPDQLKVGAWLKLPPTPTTTPAKAKPSAKPPAKPPAKAVAPAATGPAKAAKPAAPAPAPAQAPAPTPPAVQASAAVPSSPPSPLAPKPGDPVRWKFFGNTLVDWGGWKLHPGGVRVTLVQPTQAEVGPIRSQASAVAVHCRSLRQAWLINGVWEPWGVPEGRSVGQQIVLDLCANVKDTTGSSIPPPSAP